MRHGLTTRDGEAVFGMLLSGNHEQFRAPRLRA